MTRSDALIKQRDRLHASLHSRLRREPHNNLDLCAHRCAELTDTATGEPLFLARVENPAAS
jgi:hypothetical protein